MTFCKTSIDCHTEGSNSDRERPTLYDTVYMWDLKQWYKWTYLSNRNEVRDIETYLWLPRGKGAG